MDKPVPKPSLFLSTYNSALRLFYDKEKRLVQVFDRRYDGTSVKEVYIASFDETTARIWIRTKLEENYQFWLHDKMEDIDEDEDFKLLFRVGLCSNSHKEDLLSHQAILDRADLENKEEVLKKLCPFSIDFAQRALTILCSLQ